MTRPVVRSVSQATRPSGSSARTASRTASEIWSASLSGCPSVTDSEVKRYRRPMIGGLYTAALLPGPAASLLEAPDPCSEAASRRALSSSGPRFQHPGQAVTDRPRKVRLGPVPQLYVVPRG